MRTLPFSHPTRLLLLRLTLLGAFVVLESGWTCAVFFASCQGIGTQMQATSISPGSVSRNADSSLLVVAGNGFTPQTEITWNGHTVPTTFVDAQHVQTEITQQTFESFGGLQGSTVEISTSTQLKSGGSGCPVNGNSSALFLVIN